MKAIETVYKGYRFRSRLEARWAVFFDALEIEWEYEPEGFELENDMRYLPDFWLPTFNDGVWCEIKPVGGNLEKPLAFITQSQPSTQLWLCLGSPQLAIYEIINKVISPCAGGIGEFCNPYEGVESPLPIMNCEKCNRGIWEIVSYCGIPNYSAARGENRMYGAPCEHSDICKRCVYDCLPGTMKPIIIPDEIANQEQHYIRAVTHSRQARVGSPFEWHNNG